MNLSGSVSVGLKYDKLRVTSSIQSGWFPLCSPFSTGEDRVVLTGPPGFELTFWSSDRRSLLTLPVLWSTQGRLILETNCTVGGASG